MLMMMMMMMATLSMDGREGGRERDKIRRTRGAGTIHISLRVFQCRQTIFCALVSSLFHLVMTTKFIHFVQDLVAYNRRNDGLTDPVRR